MSDWFSWIGSLASIFGLAITLYVARAVWKIEKSYLRQALLPKYVTKLKAASKNIRIYCEKNDEENVKAQLLKCQYILEGLAKHIPQEYGAKRIIDKIESFQEQPDRLISNAVSIQHWIDGLVERLDLLKYELQWRGRNG